MSAARSTTRASARGLTLLEVLISVAVLVFVTMLIYGAFSTINRGKQNATQISERYRVGRLAMTRMSRELSEAFLSAHVAAIPSLITRTTAFIGTGKRIDFNAFAHRRILKDAHESDQCELSYFVATDPKDQKQSDLARREQVIIDDQPGKGGVSTIMVDDIDSFNVKYLDPLTGLWTDSWDSTSPSAQFGRMPLQVLIKLVLKQGPAREPIRMSTKTSIMIPMPLAFALK